MALASCQEARSPVELSLSPVYHYQFSSISKAIAHLITNEVDRLALQRTIQELCMSYYKRPAWQPYYLLQTDTTPLCKPHSPTMENRTYIAVANNTIAGNKPLGIGYETSYVNLSDNMGGWSLPLNIKRVSPEQTASECALSQLENLLDNPNLTPADSLIVNALDSKYGNACYLAPAHQHKRLVNTVRMRWGRKVWKQNYQTNTGGHPRIYGEKYYLQSQSGNKTYKKAKTQKTCQVFQRSIFDLPADEQRQFCTRTRKNRKLTIRLWRWNEMMIRTKNGHDMKDKPFDLMAVRVTDAQTGEQVFGREMFIAITGKRKSELPIDHGYECYRRRYNIEPSFHFSKQRLLLQDYQTPDTEHLDNWLLIQQLATWLLYTAADEARFQPRKWESYLPGNKTAKFAARLSPTQTRKAAQGLFLTFDPTPFKPVQSKKGKGRPKGMTFEPRKQYKVVKKKTKTQKRILKTEKIE